MEKVFIVEKKKKMLFAAVTHLDEWSSFETLLKLKWKRPQFA
jgi:hypothetical protein